jgi:hypothetical protein
VLADAKAPVVEGDRVRLREGALPADAGNAATRNELPARLD